MKKVLLTLICVLAVIAVANPKKSLVGARGVGNGGENLPYDAEVKYLESTGTQRIDTGVFLKLSDIVEVTYSFSNRNSPFGTYDTVSGDNYLFNLTGSGANTICRYSTVSWSTATSLNTKYSVQVGNGEFYVDGTLIGSVAFTDKEYTYATCPLFCRCGRSSGYINYSDYLKGKIYSCRIIRNGVAIRDFIPVRLEDEGYMYDRVSGELFRNQGTGSFIIGPDK